MSTTVDSALIDQFVNDPEQLLELVRATLADIKERCIHAGSQDAERKLLKISKLIEDFENSGLNVDDNLRRMKLDLVAEVEGTHDRSEEYGDVLKGLRQILDSAGEPPTNGKVGSANVATESGQGTKRRRRSKKDLTPQDLLGQYLVDVLRELGGAASKRDILKRLSEKYGHSFRPGDFESRTSGEVIWQNNTAWARWKLIQQGIMKSDSPTGIWELREDQL